MIKKIRSAALLISSSIAWVVMAASAEAQIPPHNTLVQSIPGVNVNVGKYSASGPVVSLNTWSLMDFLAHPTGFPPYTEEYLEVSATNTPATYMPISTHCNRSGPQNRLLTCNTPFELSATDAALASTNIRVRYFAKKLNNMWQGYMVGNKSALQQVGQGGAPGTGVGASSGTFSSGSGSSGLTLLCPPESAPMMPTTTVGATFQFAIPQAQLCGGTFFIDPLIATGYSYTASNTKFQQVTMPSLATVADNDGYTVSFPGSGLASISIMAGQSYTVPTPVTKFEVQGINPALALLPNNPLAFRTGVKMTPATGPVIINQTPLTGTVGPSTGPGLIGDNVKVYMLGNPANNATAIVGNNVEFIGYGLMPFAPNPKAKRWDIDVQAQKMRINFAQVIGNSTYGSGFVVNFVDLNPALPSCTGTPVITNATTTTSNSGAPVTVSGTTFSDHQVNVPLAPPSGQYNWSQSDWIETSLTFGCKP